MIQNLKVKIKKQPLKRMQVLPLIENKGSGRKYSSMTLQGPMQNFHWWGGGGGKGAQKIVCVQAHHECKAQRPLRLGP